MFTYSGRAGVKEIVAAAVVFSLIVLSVTAGEGTITCGWHFVDDHEYLEWLNIVNSGQMSWTELTWSVWRTDFGARFRPLYYPYRIFLTYLFGADLTALSVVRTIETILAFVLLYFMGREMKADRIHAFLFAMLSMTGYQSAVWWKLGPQEEECTIFFAAGMILLEKWLEKNRIGFMAGAAVCFMAMSLFHESYILVLPFILCYVWMRTYRQYDLHMHRHPHPGIDGLSRVPVLRYVFIGIMAAWLIAVLGIIVVFVGTNNYSGAGVSLGISPWTFASSYYYAIGGDLKYYFFLGIPLTAVLLTYWEEMKKLKGEFYLLLIFVIPQFILYGKESMGERYILPVIIGFCWFYLIVVPQHGIIKARRKKVYYALTLLLLVLGFRSTLIESNYYRYRGQSVTAAMQFVSDAARENGTKTVSFLGFSNPEADQTLDAWMVYQGVGDDIYHWNENMEHIQKVRPYLEPEAEDSAPLDAFDIAIAYNANDRHYTGKALPVRDGTMDQYYTRVQCGSIDLYIRNGSGIAVPEYDIEL